MSNSKYNHRGVSATKNEVHEAIKNLDKGIIKNTFCKILPDIVGHDDAWCNVMHADTAGTKTSLAYLYWKETGDISVWKGVVEDAINMNLDDMGCVGLTTDIVLSSTIGRNKHLIPGEVLKTIIEHSQAFIHMLREYGVHITLAGGETADVGDIVRTIDIGYTTFGRLKKDDVIPIDIQEGDYIIGFHSHGKALYETEYNGGMGSNGLTSARHDVLYNRYAQLYPETFDPNTDKNYIYAGSKKLTDIIHTPHGPISIGKLILSPTRTYMPLLHQLVQSYRSHLHGIIHSSGGGQTKVGKFLDKPLHIIKNNIETLPPLFALIHHESKTPLKEMFQVFNMGYRLEIYTPSITAAQEMQAIATQLGIGSHIIGRVEASDQQKITIQYQGETMTYLQGDF